MKKTLLTSLLMAGISTVQADTTLQFKPMDDSLESQICSIAATEGLQAAKQQIEANGFSFIKYTMSLTCNGESLAGFSRKYSKQRTASMDNSDTQSDDVKLIKLVAETDTPASRLCIDAVLVGETVAREKHGIKNEEIYCNRTPLKSFVASFAMQEVINDEQR